PRRANNPNLRGDVLTGPQGAVVSGPDGVFRMAVLPGPGHLLVQGPTGHHIHQEIGTNHLDAGWRGGERLYPDGLGPLDLKPGTGADEVKVTLRRGVTVKGRLVGPDGTSPVKSMALLVCRLQVHPRTHEFMGPSSPVLGGRFELHGLDPGKSYPVCFLDPLGRL